MVIDHHFGFIAASWLAGVIGIGAIALWIWLDRRALDRQLAQMEEQGMDVSRAKDPA